LKSLGFITNINALQFFQLFRFAILFAVGIAFAKSGLPTGEIGVYEKFIFLSGAVSFFWVNGLTQSMLSFSRQSEFKNNQKNPLFFHVFIISVIFSVFTVVILFSFESLIAKYILASSNISYLYVFIAYFLFSTPAFVVEYFYILLKKPKIIIVYGLLTYGIQFIALAAPIFLGKGLEISLIGLTVVAIIRFIWALALIKNHSEFKFSANFSKTYLNHSSPLILMSLIAGSIPYVDGIIVSHYYDDATFAVYRYGARELPLALLLANALSNAMIPDFTEKDKIKDSLYKLKLNSLRLMHLMFPISIILLFFSKFLYPFLFNEDFITSSTIFNVLLLLVICRLVFPQTILLGNRLNNSLVIASIIEFIIKIVFSLLLIDYYGIIGIALATVFAFFSEKIWLTIIVWKKLRIKPSEYIPIIWITIYGIILITTFIFVEYNNLID